MKKRTRGCLHRFSGPREPWRKVPTRKWRCLWAGSISGWTCCIRRRALRTLRLGHGNWTSSSERYWRCTRRWNSPRHGGALRGRDRYCGYRRPRDSGQCRERSSSCRDSEGCRRRDRDAVGSWITGRWQMCSWVIGMTNWAVFSSPRPTGRAFRGLGNDARGVLAAGLALGCFEWIGAALAGRAIPSVRADPEALGRDAFLLHDYARARRVIVGQEAIPASSSTVHRLLWGTPEDTELSDWPMAP